MGGRSYWLSPCGRCCSCRNVDPGRPNGPVHGESAEVCKDPSCAVGRSCAARNNVQLIASIVVGRGVEGVSNVCELRLRAVRSSTREVGIEELQGVKLQAQTPASGGRVSASQLRRHGISSTLRAQHQQQQTHSTTTTSSCTISLIGLRRPMSMAQFARHLHRSH